MPDYEPSQPEDAIDSGKPKRWFGIPGLRGAVPGAGDPAPPANPKPSKQNQKQLTGRLAGLSLPRQVWVLSLWPLLEQLLNFLVGTVDFAIAGRLPGEAASRDAIDAMSIAIYFVWLMTILQAAVGVGASAIVSRAIGANHRRLANAGVGQSLVLGIGASVIAAIIVYAAAPWIVGGFELDGPAAKMASDYIRITAIGIPMSGVLFVGGSVLRAAGDTRSPFFAMLLVNLVNIGASVGLGGLRLGNEADASTIGLGWGVTGIAWGTAIAWTIGGIATLVILLYGASDIRLRRHRLIPHWHTIRRIIHVATPNLGYQLLFWTINFGLILFIGMLDEPGAYGAHVIAMRIHAISFLPGYAISIAASTLTGQYLGLGDPSRARLPGWCDVSGDPRGVGTVVEPGSGGAPQARPTAPAHRRVCHAAARGEPDHQRRAAGRGRHPKRRGDQPGRADCVSPRWVVPPSDRAGLRPQGYLDRDGD